MTGTLGTEAATTSKMALATTSTINTTCSSKIVSVVAWPALYLQGCGPELAGQQITQGDGKNRLDSTRLD